MKYPYYGKSTSDVVVLFTQPQEGFCIEAGYAGLDTGHYSDYWLEEGFKEIDYKVKPTKEDSGMLSTGAISSILGFIVSSSYLKIIGSKPDIETSTGHFWDKDRINEIKLNIINDISKLKEI